MTSEGGKKSTNLYRRPAHAPSFVSKLLGAQAFGLRAGGKGPDDFPSKTRDRYHWQHGTANLWPPLSTMTNCDKN
jgi:hypothetical protein